MKWYQIFSSKFVGFYSSTGLTPCYSCPQNFFQDAAGSTTCNECPTHMTSDEHGAASREECKPQEETIWVEDDDFLC